MYRSGSADSLSTVTMMLDLYPAGSTAKDHVRSLQHPCTHALSSPSCPPTDLTMYYQHTLTLSTNTSVLFCVLVAGG